VPAAQDTVVLGQFEDALRGLLSTHPVSRARGRRRAEPQPVPPLLFLTGASGAGKTTLYHHLPVRGHEAILIDGDLLW
jgi:adenylylsulfate kinase-like enzyme